MKQQVFTEALDTLKGMGFRDANDTLLHETAAFQYLEQTLCSKEEQVIFTIPVVGGEAIIEVFNELQSAQEKWPNWPNNGFEALGLVTEELGELAQAMLQFKHEGGNHERIRLEAIQVAAMGIRFVLNLPGITKPQPASHE